MSCVLSQTVGLKMIQTITIIYIYIYIMLLYVIFLVSVRWGIEL